MMKLIDRPRIFSPGPTPVPLQTLMASLDENPYHRTEEFYSIFKNCRKLLSLIMRSKSEPLILSSSGTGAMETAVVNLTHIGDEVLTLNGGKFGERWGKICRAYECRTHEIKFPWGQAPTQELIIEQLLAHPNIKVIFFQYLETSTGVLYPIKELISVIKNHSDAIVVVDAVSAFIADEIKMDEWGIDVLITGSQKGLGLPPGLSFINFSEKTTKNFSSRPKFYFDAKREIEGQYNGQSSFTPATHLILMLQENLEKISRVGLSQINLRHSITAEAVRYAFKQMGLQLFVDEAFSSNAVTSILLPKSLDGAKLVKSLQSKFGMYFAGGQDDYTGKLLRFAHLGWFDAGDIASGLLALEYEINNLGYKLNKNVCGAKEFWSRYIENSLN